MMKGVVGGSVFLAAVFAGLATSAAEGEGPLALWYETPAERWPEALPIGNGRIGGMVFGGVPDERIQLNEDSLWSGEAQDADNPEAFEHLDEVRQLLFEGDFAEAEKRTLKTMVCSGRGSNRGNGAYSEYGSYQTLGDLRLSLDHDADEVTGYVRKLDLDAAVTSVEYDVGGTHFTRDVFASAADQVMVVRLTCDKPGGLSFRVTLDRDPRSCSHPWKNDSRIKPFDETEEREDLLAARVVGKDSLVLSGRAWRGKGMRFEARLLVLKEGGEGEEGRGRVGGPERRCGDLASGGGDGLPGRRPGGYL